jgi:hypothetical protein
MRRARDVGFFVGLAIVIMMALVLLALRFANPDMTSMQLLLTLWPLYVVALLGGFLVDWSMRHWR